MYLPSKPIRRTILNSNSRITPMSNDFAQLKLMSEHLQKAINDYKKNGYTPECYQEIIESCKNYRVAWTKIWLYVMDYRRIREDEKIIEYSKIYHEEKSRLVESAIDSLDRHLGFTKTFLRRASNQEDPL